MDAHTKLKLLNKYHSVDRGGIFNDVNDYICSCGYKRKWWLCTRCEYYMMQLYENK